MNLGRWWHPLLYFRYTGADSDGMCWGSHREHTGICRGSHREHTLGCVGDHTGNTHWDVFGITQGTHWDVSGIWNEVMGSLPRPPRWYKRLQIPVLPHRGDGCQLGGTPGFWNTSLGRWSCKMRLYVMCAVASSLLFVSSHASWCCSEESVVPSDFPPFQWKESSWFVVWHCCRWSWRWRCQEKARTGYLRWQ